MRVIDLFAGLGGNSEGAELAGCELVWAGNHWPLAVEIHAKNHPRAQHVCQDLHQANWMLVPGHDFMLASPCCQGHSKARGKAAGNPQHDASRSTAWAVVSAAEFHRKPFLVENVPEFLQWALFPAWKAALEALGYSLSLMVLDAADFGVPQHRQRLFILGTLSRHPIELQLPRRDHVPAASIIDFNAGRWSPVHKPRRSEATLRRVHNGRRQFGERFVMPYYKSGSGLTGRSLHRPIGTITTRARWAVVDGDRMRMLTADEARAAMGFRPDYVLPGSTTEALHMLGNAVCPPVVRDILTTFKGAA